MMNHMERVSRVRTMLRQVSPGDDLDSLPIPPPDRAGDLQPMSAAGDHRPSAVPQFGYNDAVEGIRKLKEQRDDQVSPAELFGVEAIVLAHDRPAVFVRGGTYDQLGGVWSQLDTMEMRNRINPLLGAIGRIELPNMVTVPYGGTGFLVGPQLLMTNRHVARLFAEGLGVDGLFYRTGDALVDFECQVDSDPAQATFITVERVLMIHPYWDMALLQVSGLPPSAQPLTLSVRAPEDLLNRDMVAVGYPARDDRNDLALQDRIFSGVYNVKRLQPGKVRRRTRVRSFENDVQAMVHDSSTLGGSSGSSVIDVSTGHVIGLHFAGEYLKANYAVPSYELARDARVLDAGVQFDGRIGVTDLWQPAWIFADGRQSAGRMFETSQGQGAARPAALGVQPAAGDTGALQIPINLRITVDVEGLPQVDIGRPEERARPGARPAVRGRGRVSMRELTDMMRDPGIDEAELRPYFKGAPELAKPFSPGIIPNPERVDIAPPRDNVEGAMAMSWANGLSRMRRQAAFQARIASGDRKPVLVSEGDSWFQFPVLLSDVIDGLSGDYNVWSVDSAGDTLQNMVFDSAEYMQALRRNAGNVKAFLFSGGGNDIIGEDGRGKSVITQILKRFQAGQPAGWYLGTPALEQKLRFIEDCYRRVLDNVAREFPDLPVVCHGYDYALPGGGPGETRNPSWAAVDKWLGRPMREELGIEDPALQRAIVHELIDRLNLVLQRLCGASYPTGLFRNAWHVDVRGTVGARWADELHPTDAGFATVSGLFDGTLRKALRMPQEGVAPELREEVPTPNIGDDVGEMAPGTDVELAPLSSSYIDSARPWRLARAITALREEVNRQAPNRSKASDGTIGDAAHRSRDSDHNPWIEDGNTGVVSAVDITHDAAGGCSAETLAQSLQSGRDPRVKYVIWNRRIMSSYAQGGTAPWVWRSYSGSNPHTKHVHISLNADKSDYDSTAPWRISV